MASLEIGAAASSVSKYATKTKLHVRRGDRNVSLCGIEMTSWRPVEVTASQMCASCQRIACS